MRPEINEYGVKGWIKTGSKRVQKEFKMGSKSGHQGSVEGHQCRGSSRGHQDVIGILSYNHSPQF